MKWTELSIQTLTSAEDIIISELYELGLEGAQIEDHIPLTEEEKSQMFVDIMPDTQPDDGKAKLNFFIAPEEGESPETFKNRVDELVASVKETLREIAEYMEIGEGTVEISETEDKDWINNWKQYFHQFTVDDILIIPSWEEVEAKDKDKLILHIDPGTAFGTGMHETTQLCIKALSKYITPETVMLDVGTGSGILSIVALKKGIKYALGTDLDPCAIEAVADNLKNNGVSEETFKLIIGNVIDTKAVQDEVGYEKYDIVTANILADVLVPLTPVVTKHIKKGGIYITSGIIEGKETLVADTMKANGFEVVDITAMGEWRSVIGKYVG